MKTYLDILPEGCSAVAVKTKGHNFNIDLSGISSTGCWVVSAQRTTDYVIVFHEKLDGNDVYIGKFAGKSAEGNTERDGKKFHRYRIFINSIRLALKTNQTWTEFVCGKNPGFERIYLQNNNQSTPVYYAPDSEEAYEGYKKDSERMNNSRDKKIADIRKKKDNYTCQSCFNQYFINGKYVIDCHHLKPIALGERKTKVEDLISLCPTCHRICHTRAPAYSIDELRELVKNMANTSYFIPSF